MNLYEQAISCDPEWEKGYFFFGMWTTDEGHPAAREERYHRGRAGASIPARLQAQALRPAQEALRVHPPGAQELWQCLAWYRPSTRAFPGCSLVRV